MSIPLRVLILEDRPADAELMLHELRRAGFDPVWERVDTEADYLSRLDPALDLILADYSLPQFDGVRALQRLQERGLDIPFIIVSGTIGEDVAVAAMKQGAADYLLKDRLARLGPAVAHALEGKRLRDERQKADEALRESERRFRALIENSQDVITLIDAGGKYLYDSPSITRVMGYAPEERVGHSISEFIHPDERQAFMERFEAFVQQPGAVEPSHGRFRHKDGSWRWMEGIRASLLAEPSIGAIVVNYRDVTERKQAQEELQRTAENLRRTLGATIQAMAFTVETRDPYTAGHQRQVANLARAIATEMGLSEEQIEGIRMAAVIHDMGKITVPTDILNKPGRLNEHEFGIIKAHPEVAYNILKTIEFPWPIAQIIFQHHERMDGSGYPQGLSGEEIIVEARVLAVADVVEAMASFRPYRPALGIDKALEEISQDRGVLYDPEVVDACLKLFTEKGFKFE